MTVARRKARRGEPRAEATPLDDVCWEDGVPPEARGAWQASTARNTGVEWDAWARERKESRPVAVPVTVAAMLAVAVVAALVTSPAPVAGRPMAVAADVPTRKLVARAKPTTPAPAPSTTAPAPPPPTQQQPPPAQDPPAQRAGTVRLADGGTATLVRKDVVDGVLPVPEGVREATWWGAPFDGTTGATVLAGHVNWKGATGPFAALWDARPGDRVTVVDDQGRTFTYAVSQIVTVHKNELPARAQELFGQDGTHRLVLVTCGGRWVGGQNGYEENRIVIATPQP